MKTFFLIYVAIGLLLTLVLTTIALHTKFGQTRTASKSVEGCKQMNLLAFIFWGAISVPLWPVTIYVGVVAGVHAYRSEMERQRGRGE